MKLSQYTYQYLESNRRRGDGKGLTVGSFIAYNVRGKARNYAGRYTQALIRSLEKINAKKGKSIYGGVAYY